MDAQATRDINRKLKILRYGEQIGNMAKACRIVDEKSPRVIHFGVLGCLTTRFLHACISICRWIYNYASGL